MRVAETHAPSNMSQAGDEMHSFAAELYPICRSITGEGLRDTLRRIGERIPIKTTEVPTGTKVFDWAIPREWNIRDAYVRNDRGEKVVDFASSNLHVVGYSMPVDERLSLEQLRSRVTTIPEHPSWIPYRTSYYAETWGFCLSHETLLGLEEGDYDVCIDSTLEDGSLTYGECLLPGECQEEVLVSTHVCHPSLANDNLSGIVVATELARFLASRSNRLSFRFVFVPGTIGAIAWLHANRETTSRISHGVVLTCLGDSGAPTYKRSRRGDAVIDRAFAHVLLHSDGDSAIRDFSPDGYDERQYCSPGFDLPVGCFMRTPHGEFPEYHTSADALDLLNATSLADSLEKLVRVVTILDDNAVYANTNPHGEPHLGPRGLLRLAGGRKKTVLEEQAMLWVLNLSDTSNSLLDIAERSGLEFALVRAAADCLLAHELLESVA